MPAERFWVNLLATMRSFYDQGDQNLRHNLPGQPLHDRFLALLFSLGGFVALSQLHKPRNRLIVIWFLVMILPTLLSIHAPHSLRLVVLPPLAILYALGGEALLRLFAALESAHRWWKNSIGVDSHHQR